MNEIKCNDWGRQWDESFLLGNGRLGAAVYGTPEELTISLNEESIWSKLLKDRNNPKAADALEKSREFFKKGNLKKTERLLLDGCTGCPDSMADYEPAGTLKINMSREKCTGQRSLELDYARMRMQWRERYGAFKAECFVSAPDNVLCFKAESAEKTGKINAVVRLSVPEREGQTVCWHGEQEKDSDEREIISSVTCRCAVPYNISYKVCADGGACRKKGGELIVKDADSLYIYLTAEPVKDEDSGQGDKEKMFGASSWERLLRRHISEYETYYKRVKLKLDKGNEIYEKFFNFSRYLLISSSRPKTAAATLQGIWNDVMRAPWGSRYTLNINIQMLYWLAESCSLSECHEPLIGLLEKIYVNGRKTAEKMYRAPGYVCHHNTDIWGDSAPQDSCLTSTFWLMAVPWLCTHLWEHYIYTKNSQYLKERFYLIEEACRFFIHVLRKNEDGLYECFPSTSPENSFLVPDKENMTTPFCRHSTMDSQILRDLFSLYIAAAKETKTEASLLEEAEEILEHLPKTEISPEGTVMEWDGDFLETEIGHRHISHLYGLYPSRQISPLKDKRLAEAAKKSLERRSSEQGITDGGWNEAWIACCYARLFEGDEALKHIDAVLCGLSTSGLNVFEKRELLAEHKLFQMDANMGIGAAMAELLVQHIGEKLLLLPALPKKWKNGSICGISLPGRKRVDIIWENGRVSSAIIYAEAEENVCIVCNEKEYRVKLKKGANKINA